MVSEIIGAMDPKEKETACIYSPPVRQLCVQEPIGRLCNCNRLTIYRNSNPAELSHIELEGIFPLRCVITSHIPRSLINYYKRPRTCSTVDVEVIIFLSVLYWHCTDYESHLPPLDDHEERGSIFTSLTAFTKPG